MVRMQIAVVMRAIKKKEANMCHIYRLYNFKQMMLKIYSFEIVGKSALKVPNERERGEGD